MKISDELGPLDMSSENNLDAVERLTNVLVCPAAAQDLRMKMARRVSVGDFNSNPRLPQDVGYRYGCNIIFNRPGQVTGWRGATAR